MPIKCPNCSTTCQDDQSYCGSCGSSLQADAGKQGSSELEQEKYHAQTDTPASAGDRTSAEPVQELPPPKASRVYRGIVTNLRPWLTTERKLRKRYPEFLFDLRRTSESWEPLRNSQGYPLPIVQVEYRSDRLYGSPLSEGCRVVIKGRFKRGVRRLKVKRIWNRDSGADISVAAGRVTYWGRVEDFRVDQAVDKRSSQANPQATLDVWRFRLHQTTPDFQNLVRDQRGEPIPPIPVEIRAATISGPLKNGDKAEVQGKMARGTLFAMRVLNQTASGAEVAIRNWAGLT